MEEKSIFDTMPDDVKQIMNKIEVTAPVFKYNPNLENTAAIAAMYLMIQPSEDDLHKTLDDVADIKEVEPLTILLFNSRHIIEMGNFTYGILQLFLSNNIIDKEVLVKTIKSLCAYLGSGPKFYYEYIDQLHNTIDGIETLRNKTLKEALDPTILDRVYYIMEKMIFIPYNKIDDLAKKIAKEYKDATEKETDKQSGSSD